MAAEVLINTSVESTGTIPLLQFAGLFQLPIAPPTQETCACNKVVEVKTTKTNNNIITKLKFLF